MAGSFANMARRIGIESFLVLTIGLVLGLFGPFGTFEMAPAVRIAFWMGYTLLGYAIFRPMIVVGRWVSEALSLPPIIGVGLALVLAAVPLTFMIALLIAGFDVAKALRWDGLPMLYFDVWLIGFLINGFFTLAFRDKEIAAAPPVVDLPARPAQTEIEAVPDTPRFTDRLPMGFGPLLALKGEDHYVRAIGETRDELLLLRLRDAMAELGDAEGQSVHRSWWVARAAVASVQREGRNATLILSNGTEVPVARDAVAQLRKAGWLN